MRECVCAPKERNEIAIEWKLVPAAIFSLASPLLLDRAHILGNYIWIHDTEICYQRSPANVQCAMCNVLMRMRRCQTHTDSHTIHLPEKLGHSCLLAEICYTLCHVPFAIWVSPCAVCTPNWNSTQKYSCQFAILRCTRHWFRIAYLTHTHNTN